MSISLRTPGSRLRLASILASFSASSCQKAQFVDVRAAFLSQSASPTCVVSTDLLATRSSIDVPQHASRRVPLTATTNLATLQSPIQLKALARSLLLANCQDSDRLQVARRFDTF